MPHGSLTPLGRQLRSVLANLRLPAKRIHNAHIRCRSAASSAAASEQEESVIIISPPIRRAYSEPRLLSRRRLNRRTRVHRVTEALQNVGKDEIAAETPPLKLDLSHVNVRGRRFRRTHADTFRRQERDRGPNVTRSKKASLEAILARCIQHQATVADTGQAEWMTPLSLRHTELELLDAKGYSHDDVRIWAEILSRPDSLEAATLLAERIATHGPQSIPLSVFLYILRRPYVNARALGLLYQQAWVILNYSRSANIYGHVPENAIFMVFVRLVRHAREVWPKAMETLPDVLLRFLPNNDNAYGEERSMMQLETLTYMLNKAMGLIAVPTAIEPFKNNYVQQVAIIRILEFMAQHHPPLQITREGYRAVILVQLAQRKTEKESQWAELKALSWPPWKENRTAMDADITREDHGTSKASEVLARMQEAGYGPLRWERVATTYAGWNTDDTPTIQTLVLLGRRGGRLGNDSALWAARIMTTRTVQEAWACFLSYEDQGGWQNLRSGNSSSGSSRLLEAPAQEIFLAVFRKLHREEKRRRESEKLRLVPVNEDRRRLFPGDTPEVQPLPPSTHLHTYTRTSPPSVDGFFRYLRKRSVVLDGHCLAFLVANARTLKLGTEYLSASLTQYPAIQGMLLLDRAHDITEIPMPLFAAFIELLSRFPNVSLLSAIPAHFTKAYDPSPASRLLDDQELNDQHTLVHAIELLWWRRPVFRPAWNSVLRGLGRTSPFQKVGGMPLRRSSSRMQTEQDKWSNQIIVNRLGRLVRTEMRRTNLDLDMVGFQALCQVAENAVKACWKTMRHERWEHDAHHIIQGMHSIIGARDARPIDRLKKEFRIVVGDDEPTRPTTDVSGTRPKGMPHQNKGLLEVPNPAILHSYIRALGWMADYDGLLETVRWMVQHKTELAERRKRDRNGEAMMLRVFAAIRVFLERSWLAAMKAEDHMSSSKNQTTAHMFLRQLESAASKEMVDEIQALIESVEDWGGWPSDEDVEVYYQHGRFVEF